jgi:chromodomain-helicase-DNA-binding protein 4
VAGSGGKLFCNYSPQCLALDLRSPVALSVLSLPTGAVWLGRFECILFKGNLIQPSTNSTQRHEILKAAQDRDRELLESAQAERRARAAGPDGDNDEGLSTRIEVKKRPGLTPNQTTEFICGSCMKGGICMGCLAVVLQPDTSAETKKDVSPGASVNLDGDLKMADSTQNAQKKQTGGSTQELISREILFRCFTCKRLSHYEHLPIPPEYSEEEASVDSVMLAEYYQSNTEWHCSDCFSYKWELDKILAWRPYPSTAVEPPHPPNEPPHYKSALPREYLVKWLSRSYRRTQWVPHMWLVTTHAAKLKNFLDVGAKVELLEKALPDEDAVAVNDEAKIVDEGNTASIPFEISADADQDSSRGGSKSLALPLGATPDAERRIPLAWKTIDRVLDVLLWRPTKRKDSQLKKTQEKRKGKKKKTVPSSEDEDDEDENSNDVLHGPIKAELELAFAEGEQPSYDLTETVREWETRTGRSITTDQIKNVVWVFIKWDDLSYDEGKHLVKSSDSYLLMLVFSNMGFTSS